MATLEETLRSLGLSAARGIPQLATGFVDLAALPFTATGMLKPEEAVGSTAYLTSKGLLPPEQQGLLNQTTELLSGAMNPAVATKAALAKGGLLMAAPSVMGSIKSVKPAESLLNYRSTHTAPSPEFGAPLYDLTGGGQMYPADVYSSKATQYYGTGYPKADKEAFALANRVRGNPEAEVTMYRAVPKSKDITSINIGDWVSLSKDYAKNHGESVLGNNYKIIEQKVKAKDLWTNADSIHEFGYHPSK